MRVRRKIFTKEFLAQFDEEHKTAVGPEGEGVNEVGYPDIGNGYYARKLPYRDWL